MLLRFGGCDVRWCHLHLYTYHLFNDFLSWEFDWNRLKLWDVMKISICSARVLRWLLSAEFVHRFIPGHCLVVPWVLGFSFRGWHKSTLYDYHLRRTVDWEPLLKDGSWWKKSFPVFEINDLPWWTNQFRVCRSGELWIWNQTFWMSLFSWLWFKETFEKTGLYLPWDCLNLFLLSIFTLKECKSNSLRDNLSTAVANLA